MSFWVLMANDCHPMIPTHAFQKQNAQREMLRLEWLWRWLGSLLVLPTSTFYASLAESKQYGQSDVDAESRTLAAGISSVLGLQVNKPGRTAIVAVLEMEVDPSLTQAAVIAKHGTSKDSLRKYRELVRRYRLAACDSAQSSSTVIAGAGAAVAGVVAAAAASPLVASACVVTSAILVSQEWLTRHAPAVKRARVVRQDASLRTIEATVEHDGMEVEHEVDIPYAASPEQEEGVKRHKRLQSNWASESSALRKLDVTAAGDHKARDSERKRAWRLNRHQQREVHAVLEDILLQVCGDEETDEDEPRIPTEMELLIERESPFFQYRDVLPQRASSHDIYCLKAGDWAWLPSREHRSHPRLVRVDRRRRSGKTEITRCNMSNFEFEHRILINPGTPLLCLHDRRPRFVGERVRLVDRSGGLGFSISGHLHHDVDYALYTHGKEYGESGISHATDLFLDIPPQFQHPALEFYYRWTWGQMRDDVEAGKSDLAMITELDLTERVQLRGGNFTRGTATVRLFDPVSMSYTGPMCTLPLHNVDGLGFQTSIAEARAAALSSLIRSTSQVEDLVSEERPYRAPWSFELTSVACLPSDKVTALDSAPDPRSLASLVAEWELDEQLVQRLILLQETAEHEMRLMKLVQGQFQRQVAQACLRADSNWPAVYSACLLLEAGNGSRVSKSMCFSAGPFTTRQWSCRKMPTNDSEMRRDPGHPSNQVYIEGDDIDNDEDWVSMETMRIDCRDIVTLGSFLLW